MMRKQSKVGQLDYDPPTIDIEQDDTVVARQKALDLAMKTLDGDERELFLLHTVEGVRLKVLAAEHEISVPAMKSRVHRIRSKIRLKALAVLEEAGATA